jgi:hypothetical protein
MASANEPLTLGDAAFANGSTAVVAFASSIASGMNASITARNLLVGMTVGCAVGASWKMFRYWRQERAQVRR